VAGVRGWRAPVKGGHYGPPAREYLRHPKPVGALLPMQAADGGQWAELSLDFVRYLFYLVKRRMPKGE